MKGKQAEIQVQSKGKEAGDGHGDVVAGPGDGSAARQGASSAGSAGGAENVREMSREIKVHLSKLVEAGLGEEEAWKALEALRGMRSKRLQGLHRFFLSQSSLHKVEKVNF